MIAIKRQRGGDIIDYEERRNAGDFWFRHVSFEPRFCQRGVDTAANQTLNFLRNTLPRLGSTILFGVDRSCLQARTLAVRQPDKQFIFIRISNHQGWLAPLNDTCFDAFFTDMATNFAGLIVVKPDEYPAVTSPSFCGLTGLIHDQLESEQTHLKHVRPTLFLIVPV